MSKKLLAVSIFALALAACGTPKKAPDDKNNPGGGGPGGNTNEHSISTIDFLALCQAQPGAFEPENDPDRCYVPHTKHIDKGTTGTVPIFAAQQWNYLVTEGTPGAVAIVQNGRRIADVHGTRMLLNQAGIVAFQVLLETQSEASAVIYSCFDRFSDVPNKMRPVICEAGKIP